MLICTYCLKLSAQEKIETKGLVGTWKIKTFLSEGNFYYNFQKDSIAFYAKGVIKTLARGGEDSIAVRNSVNDLVTELKDQEFQFNENLTLLILSRKEGVSVKEDATYSLDEKKKTIIITPKVNQPNSNESSIRTGKIMNLTNSVLALLYEQDGSKITFEYGRVE